jgi:hypothetical protein
MSARSRAVRPGPPPQRRPSSLRPYPRKALTRGAPLRIAPMLISSNLDGEARPIGPVDVATTPRPCSRINSVRPTRERRYPSSQGFQPIFRFCTPRSTTYSHSGPIAYRWPTDTSRAAFSSSLRCRFPPIEPSGSSSVDGAALSRLPLPLLESICSPTAQRRSSLYSWASRLIWIPIAPEPRECCHSDRGSRSTVSAP